MSHKNPPRIKKINSNYQTELGVIRFDRQAKFALFQEKFQNGFYDCIMIDEVQDLPVISVNMLSFLSPSREPNRFILSGDKYQTLNGQNFDWAQVSYQFNTISDRIMKDHSDFVYFSVHHLRGLRWSREEINYVIGTRLDENFEIIQTYLNSLCILGKIGRQKVTSMNQIRKKISF